MKKQWKLLIPGAALCLLLISASYAWFRNNQQTSLAGSDSIQIMGSGVMLTAYATDQEGDEINAAAAQYGSSLPMNLDGKYMNVSGSGTAFYEATFNAEGAPMEDGWNPAGADSAAADGDSGQYVTADIYFKSDSPMDIYLMEGSDIAPKTNGNDLVNAGNYSGYTKFSEFTDGLPALNINQSAYGLFSRNLIAGASRVSFTEYTEEDGIWTAPDCPGVVWVPHSSYQLTAQTDKDKLYQMNLNGTKEASFRFYNGAEVVTVERLPQELGSQLTGVLYIRKTAGSDWEMVTEKTVDHDQLVPARTLENYVYPIPQIWLTDQYADAAWSEALGCYVRAEYDTTFSLTEGFAYTAVLNGTEIRVQENPDGGYVAAELQDGRWKATGTVYTSEEQIESIEESFVKDTAEYQVTHWMEDSDISVMTEDQCRVSRYKIGTTEAIDSSGSYYTRVRIAVWVEGYDREADIALNSGEFNISLRFYGKKREAS